MTDIGTSGPLDSSLILVDADDERPSSTFDPALIIVTCANCGARLEDRACKLICRCGYFLSCSDYH